VRAETKEGKKTGGRGIAKGGRQEREGRGGGTEEKGGEGGGGKEKSRPMVISKSRRLCGRALDS